MAVILPKFELLTLPFRVGEVRRVGHVERFRPELQLKARRQLEDPEQARVEIDHARAAHGVAADIPEPHVGHARERAGVEVGPIVADVAQDLDVDAFQQNSVQSE